MEFRILGTLEVYEDGRMLAAGTPRTRSVLGILLAQPGSVVSVDRFVDELWSDRPPPDARALVHGQISRLRRALRSGAAAPDRLVTRKPGYLLRVENGELDLHRFGRLAAEARAARRAGDLRRCLALFAQAHRHWRGAPFADVPPTPTITAAANAMAELRLTTLEDWYEIALEAGHHADLLAELSELVTANPLRERLVAQLVLALYRGGRTADALNAYQRAKKQLADELGVDPGPELQKLELAILRGEPGPAAARPDAAQQPQPPAQLPAAVTGFSGRADQIAQLDAMLDGATAVVISVVSGTAGVGKSALAVHWAHRVADRFPDGQLYVNLRGFHPGGSVMSPTDALRGFLDALGTPPERIPADLDAQAALYRSQLAGRRLLVVLDNARDADQVRPLLPGSPTCVAVVTSRNQLTSLVAADGAHPITLDLLSTVEAQTLLARRLGANRVDAEPHAVNQIIKSCTWLPLALAVAAARAQQTGFPLAVLATEFDNADGRLDALDTGDPAGQVRAVFSWSYTSLTPPAARLFRLLALHPGPDISAAAAASLAGRDPTYVHQMLAELTRANLLTEHTPGRYTCHDLLRAYAADLTRAHDTDEQRRAATTRMLDHYLHTTHSADRQLYPHRDPIRRPLLPPSEDTHPENLIGYREAMAWLTVEHRVVLAALRQAADAGFDNHTWQMAWTLDTFLNRQGHWHDQATAAEAALAAADRLGDSGAQADAHRLHAHADIRLGRHDDASTHLWRALDLYSHAGDQAGQAHTHNNLASLRERLGQLGEALHHARESLTLFRAAGHRRGQGIALNELGWCHTLLGDHTEALIRCEQALTLLQQIGDRDGEASTWDSLGHAHHHLGHYTQASHCYQHALTLRRDIGARYTEADTLNRLGDAHHAAGNPNAARAAWQQALSILADLDHPDTSGVRAKLHDLDPDKP